MQCGGHKMENLPNDVRVEFLPPRTTTKYQTLDLSMIAHGKILYLSFVTIHT